MDKKERMIYSHKVMGDRKDRLEGVMSAAEIEAAAAWIRSDAEKSGNDYDFYLNKLSRLDEANMRECLIGKVDVKKSLSELNVMVKDNWDEMGEKMCRIWGIDEKKVNVVDDSPCVERRLLPMFSEFTENMILIALVIAFFAVIGYFKIYGK